MRSLIRRRKSAAMRPDPAPSRLGYRYQRMLLTPAFRATVRIGVPILLIATIVASWASQPENRRQATALVQQTKQNFQHRPQFMVRGMDITGADLDVLTAVTDFLPTQFPVSSFDLDLAGIRSRIEALDAVKSASVRLGQAGTLQVRLVPRVPVALWRDGAILQLIDAEGVISGTLANRAARPDLPLIAGAGAEDHIAEALALFAAAAPLLTRVRGLVRMGERRWDMVLDRSQRILLPATQAVASLERVIVLHHAQDMLTRDINIIDMRNPGRPTLRMTPVAAVTLRAANAPTTNSEVSN